jgi:transposase
MVLEWRRERDRTDGGFEEVAQKLGVHPESIRNWPKTQQVDAGERPGLTTVERKGLPNWSGKTGSCDGLH